MQRRIVAGIRKTPAKLIKNKILKDLFVLLFINFVYICINKLFKR